MSRDAHAHTLQAKAVEDGEPFDEKMQRLVATLNEQLAECAKPEKTIRKNLASLGFSQGKLGKP